MKATHSQTIVIFLFLLSSCEKVHADNYLEYLDIHANSSMAVLVIDMFESDEDELPGLPSTPQHIASIAEKVFDLGGIVICVTDYLSQNPERVCPDRVIPKRIKDAAEEKRYILLEKNQNSAFAETDLKKILFENHINHVVVTGAYTDLCIRDTALDALALPLDITLFFGAVTTIMNGLAPCYSADTHEYQLNKEASDFYELLDDLHKHMTVNQLHVICVPSRPRSKPGRFYPDDGQGYIKGLFSLAK